MSRNNVIGWAGLHCLAMIWGLSAGYLAMSVFTLLLYPAITLNMLYDYLLRQGYTSGDAIIFGIVLHIAPFFIYKITTPILKYFDNLLPNNRKEGKNCYDRFFGIFFLQVFLFLWFCIILVVFES